jgi:hypothetical protein
MHRFRSWTLDPPEWRTQRNRILAVEGGDGSTLSLDFTTGVLDPRLTFTRASTTATYINSSGYVTTAGTNVARFDHDPTTLAPRGLLIEGSATNLALRSGDFNTTVTDGTNWSASGYTAGTLSTSLPDGTTGNARRISIASGSGSFRSTTITVTASTAYTFSFWARNNGGSQARFRVWNVTAGSSIVDYTQSINNYVSQIGGANNTSSTWVRVSVQFTTPAGCTAIYVYPTSSDSGTVDLLVWGAQVEAGSGASSYIPTGASQATRVQDLVSITSTNFSSWWTSNNPASFLVDVSSTNRPLANHIFRIADSSGSAYGYQSYFNSTTMPMQVRAAMSSTASSDVAIGSNLAANTRTKIGFTVETASLKRFRDGSPASTLNTPTLPPNMLTQMYIGGTSTFGNSSADFHIRQFKYWPITLSDAVMQGLTT